LPSDAKVPGNMGKHIEIPMNGEEALLQMAKLMGMD